MRRSSTNFYNDIRVVGIDLDQTLYPKSPEIDFAIQQYIYLKISEHNQCSPEEAERAFRNLYKDGSGLGGTASLEALGIPKAANIIQEALERAPIDKFLVPDPKTIELLFLIKKEYENLDLITGSNGYNSERKLKKLGISPELFSHTLTADDGSKSNGSIYTKWLSLYPLVPPEQFLYIGDRPFSDFEAPKKLGIKAILVNRPEVEKEYDCLQLPSLEALAEYI